MATIPTPQGFSYKADWLRLATYLDDAFPDIAPGHTLDAALWLLAYLRRLDDAGALPVQTEEGELLRRVEAQWTAEQVAGESDTSSPPVAG
jgi:hypothetical protein